MSGIPVVAEKRKEEGMESVAVLRTDGAGRMGKMRGAGEGCVEGGGAGIGGKIEGMRGADGDAAKSVVLVERRRKL